MSASGNGARCARITAPTATPGIFSARPCPQRAYRWGEDGIAGICDDHQHLCFALALWNGARSDPQGAAVRPDQQRGQSRRGRQGVLLLSRQHADALLHEVCSTSIRSAAFPYARSDRGEPRGAARDRSRIRAARHRRLRRRSLLRRLRRVCEGRARRHPDAHHARPIAARTPRRCMCCRTLWFRNTGRGRQDATKPRDRDRAGDAAVAIDASHTARPHRTGCLRRPPTSCSSRENETNDRAAVWRRRTRRRTSRTASTTMSSTARRTRSIRRDVGTKAAAHYRCDRAGAARPCAFELRLTPGAARSQPLRRGVRRDLRDAPARGRRVLCDAAAPTSPTPTRATCSGRRSPACCGASNSTTTTCTRWLDGDPASPPPPERASTAATATGAHLNNADIMSMPDKWEYPWFAAWDLAFHCVAVRADRPRLRQASTPAADARMVHAPERPASRLRVGFRRCQSAGACLGGAARLPDRRGSITARGDREFLERIFHKLLLNFTWWVNRKDAEGRNIFRGRLSRARQYRRLRPHRAAADRRLHRAGRRHRWMAMYCLNMLRDRARTGAATIRSTRTSRPSSSSTSSISARRSTMSADDANGLWDDDDGFYYDVLQLPDGTHDSDEGFDRSSG